MTTNAIAATSAAATTAANSTSSPLVSGQAASDFLNILIAQMKNQDPTNPLSNADMTSQLAQLNMVSGINQLNTTMQVSQSSAAAGLLGHTVFTAGNTIQLSGGTAQFGVNLPSAASSVNVSVLNAAGNVVDIMNLGAKPAGVQTLTWNGTTTTGGTAPDGAYTFQVQAAENGQNITTTPLSAGKVNDVSVAGGVASLNVGSLGNVSMANVVQIS